jgi:hypothetical protein
LVRWADSFTGLHLNTFFDAEGNRVRAFTDTCGAQKTPSRAKTGTNGNPLTPAPGGCLV